MIIECEEKNTHEIMSRLSERRENANIPKNMREKDIESSNKKAAVENRLEKSAFEVSMARTRSRSSDEAIDSTIASTTSFLPELVLAI